MNFRLPTISNPEPLYQQIADIVEEKITNKEISINQKLPPEGDLSRTFNVSVYTVREALAKLVEQGYLLRRQNLGTFVISSTPQQNLTLRRKNEIGFIICPTRGDENLFPQHQEKPHYHQIARGIEKEIRKKNCFMIYSTIDGQELSLMEKEKDLAGLIVTGGVTQKIFKMLKKTKIPFVLIGDVEEGESVAVDTDIICIDDFQEIHMAARNLIELGHTRILFVSREFTKRPWDINALEGYKHALGESGIVFDKDLLLETGKFDFEGGYSAMNEFLDKSINFTGIIYIGGILCEGAIKALHERKIQIPEEGIVVIEDRIPGFKAVTYNEQEFGRVAAERLFKRLANPGLKPERIFIPLELAGENSQNIKNNSGGVYNR